MPQVTLPREVPVKVDAVSAPAETSDKRVRIVQLCTGSSPGGSIACEGYNSGNDSGCQSRASSTNLIKQEHGQTYKQPWPVFTNASEQPALISPRSPVIIFKP